MRQLFLMSHHAFCWSNGATVHIDAEPSENKDYLLATRKLHFSASESLNELRFVHVLATNRHYNLTNVNTGNSAKRLSVGTPHSGLQSKIGNKYAKLPISACARQHLIDAHNVVRMHTHAKMESILATILHEILVGANTSSLQSFA